MHFFNQLPFAWIEEMNEVWHDCHHFLHSILQVLPWHDQKCETTGCKHDTHGPHTQLRMSSLKQTEERSQSLEPRPSGTGSVQKQHHSPSAPNQNIKDMQFVFFVSDTAISICVCELQKTHHHYQNVSPETGPDSIMGGLGFRRCWRVKQLFKDLLCVSDVALHAISDLSFNLTKIKDIMKTFGFLGGGNWQPITKLTKSFKITGAGGRLRT